MDVRRVLPEEYDAVGELSVRVYVTDGHTDPDSAYLAYLGDAARRDTEGELWVAADGSRLLGAVTWCPPGSPSRELAGDGEGEFRALVVDPAARNRGVGAALVRHCIGLSRADGDSGMVISTQASMQDAHRLYARLGFTRDHARDWSPMPGVDLLALRLRYDVEPDPPG